MHCQSETYIYIYFVRVTLPVLTHKFSIQLHPVISGQQVNVDRSAQEHVVGTDNHSFAIKRRNEESKISFLSRKKNYSVFEKRKKNYIVFLTIGCPCDLFINQTNFLIQKLKNIA